MNAEILAPWELRTIRIDGHGSFVIPHDLADAVARMCAAAHEITEATNGTQVPVYLVGSGANYIACIKFIRQVTGKSLKDAKAFCDRARGGERMLLGRFAWNKAQQIKDEGADYDAIVEIPSPLEMLAEQAE